MAVDSLGTAKPMARDHRKLRVFVLADELLLDSYRVSQRFPPAERFGLQGQLRRAAYGAAGGIVEGCARGTTREYVNFLNIASASATEARYAIDVSHRLGYISTERCEDMVARYSDLIGGLQSLMRSLEDQP